MRWWRRVFRAIGLLNCTTCGKSVKCISCNSDAITRHLSFISETKRSDIKHYCKEHDPFLRKN